MAKRKDAKWRRFEQLASEVQAALAPDAVVKSPDFVTGISGTRREIDISVRQTIGQYQMFIAMDCKDYSKPVDIKAVEAFMGLVADVRAHRGVMVAANGFTEAAIRKASMAGIETYQLVHGGEHEWKTLVFVPMLFDVTSLLSYAIRLRGSGRFRIGPDFDALGQVLYGPGPAWESQGTVYESVARAWNTAEARPAGQLELPLGRRPTFFKAGEAFSEVEVSAVCTVERRFYLKQVGLQGLTGFYDQSNASLIGAGGFSTESIDTWTLAETATEIESEASLAVRPLMRMSFATGFDAPVGRKVERYIAIDARPVEPEKAP